LVKKTTLGEARRGHKEAKIEEVFRSKVSRQSRKLEEIDRPNVGAREVV